MVSGAMSTPWFSVDFEKKKKNPVRQLSVRLLSAWIFFPQKPLIAVHLMYPFFCELFHYRNLSTWSGRAAGWLVTSATGGPRLGAGMRHEVYIK